MKLACASAGTAGAPTVVLLHSLGTDGTIWRDQVAALESTHSVLVPDARGHGRSGEGHPSSLDDWVDDLEQTLDAAGAGNVTLVGLSMGGVQALAFAVAHPDRVDGLLVADSFAELGPDAAAAKVKTLGDRAREQGMAALADEYVAETFTRSPLPEAAEWVRRAIAGMSAAAYADAVRVCFGARLDAHLGSIRAPTLVTWGADDAKTPRQLSEALVDGIPGSWLAEVPDAGHLAPLENPEAFNALLTDWLAALPVAGRAA